RRSVVACLFRASLPSADASDTSIRAGVEDNLAYRLRAAAMEGGREHGGIHGGFQSDRVCPRAPHPDCPVGIRLPTLPEEAGGTLALAPVSISERSAYCRRAPPLKTAAAKKTSSAAAMLHRQMLC